MYRRILVPLDGTPVSEQALAYAIAMTSHGYGGVKRMVLGSVANKVLRGAECAVLVVHPRSE